MWEFRTPQYLYVYIYTHISIPERHIAELHTQYGFFDEQGAQSGSTY